MATGGRGASALAFAHYDAQRRRESGRGAVIEARAIEARPAADHSAPRIETPRQVMSQLAEFSRRLPDGPIEVSLSPEELGRVRLLLQAAEGGMVVQIAAERSETLDLIRRNIDLLAQDLRGQGYTELRFAFGDAQTGGKGGYSSPDGPEQMVAQLDRDGARPIPGMTAETGLDIRL